MLLPQDFYLSGFTADWRTGLSSFPVPRREVLMGLSWVRPSPRPITGGGGGASWLEAGGRGVARVFVIFFRVLGLP